MNDNNILYGKEPAQEILEYVSNSVQGLKTAGVYPRLVTVQIGEDPASRVYLASQMRSAEKVGIKSELVNLPDNASQAEATKTIEQMNDDPSIHGIMLHMPVPKHLDGRALQWAIDSKKDVEGVTPYNLGRLFLGQPGLAPCTALSVIRLIKETGVKLRGLEAVVVGRSDIVGKPVSLMLTGLDCTVTLCHSGTSERGVLKDHVKRADILVASIGKPNFIPGEWVKPGAIVIDVGINYVDGKLVGDVEFGEAAKRAAFITPVPGGVGTVTVAYLCKNLLDAINWQMKVED
ncbi:MAG: bifunctional 5,10-methylenetetrahydrofolate dehydrogenase/5,10-methenyltetrahydrofolate cyclohydrolase [Bacillota bacterium]